MAKNAFDELLASLPEEKRKAIEGVVEEVPQFREGFLLRSDYSRRMDEVTKLQKDAESVIQKAKEADQWINWAKENYVYPEKEGERGYTRSELAALQQLEQERKLREELETKLSSGGEMTAQEIEQLLERKIVERKLISQDAAEQALAGVRDELKAANERIQGNTQFGMGMTKFVVKHLREYNDELDPNELLKFATDNRINDLDSAYEKFTAPKRQELEAKKKEDEIAARVAEALKEWESAHVQTVDDQSGGLSDYGFSDPKVEVKIPEGARLGKGTLAAEAAKYDWAKIARSGG